MVKSNFNDEKIKSFAKRLGIDVLGKTLWGLLIEIKEILLLRKKVDIKLVSTYEEDPLRQLCSVLDNIGIESNFYTEKYDMFCENQSRQKAEYEQVISQYQKQREMEENKFIEQVLLLFFEKEKKHNAYTFSFFLIMTIICKYF